MSPKTMFSRPIKKQTMAEQMAEAIQESILSGELAAGAVLPTEPELASQFGVSRAVVRDATRILMARGLVEVQHGRGVFVTQPDNEAFAQALLLALQRVGASAWDVEQFDQLLFPQVVALAAASATDRDLATIQQLAKDYDALFARHHATWWGSASPTAELERLRAAYRRLMLGIVDATHNQVLRQLARPLLNLRNLRNWAEAEGATPETLADTEAYYIHQLVDAIASRDPAHAQALVMRLMALPPEAIEAMRRTPVGEIVSIPVPQRSPTSSP